jgi:hypothetical protein
MPTISSRRPIRPIKVCAAQAKSESSTDLEREIVQSALVLHDESIAALERRVRNLESRLIRRGL